MAIELVPMDTGVAFAKIGIQGFGGSGKTYTAAEIAIGLHKKYGFKTAIAMFDTETGAAYIGPRVKKETGMSLLGHRGRTLGDAIDFVKACVEQKIMVTIVDSVTHLWKEVCRSFLKQLNERRQNDGKGILKNIPFSEWGTVKDKWEKFTNAFLNSPMHMIICGRAGYEWDFQEDDETGKKQLVKTGIKMKAEGEFAYEPSLLLEMERVQTGMGSANSRHGIKRVCTVLKCRFGVLDAMECENPTFEFFKPHIDLLTPGSSNTVDTDKETDMEIGPDGDSQYYRDRKTKTILCEEIAGVIAAKFPGQSADQKQAKANVLLKTFGTYSWTAVETMPVAKLREGLSYLPTRIEELVEKDRQDSMDRDRVKAEEKAAAEKLKADKKATAEKEKADSRVAVERKRLEKKLEAQKSKADKS